MINQKMRALGAKRSVIRELFEYGKKRKAEIGEENVYDFSLGNPSVAPPEKVNENLQLLESAKTTITGKYNLHGSTYVYKLSSTIDWGTFINAVISFMIVAVTLFVIVKVVARMRKFREELQVKVKREDVAE